MPTQNYSLMLFRGIARPLFLLLVLGLVNCSSETSAPTQSSLPPVGALVGYDGCISLQSPTSTDDCLEWEYTKEGALKITHLGAGFNCCPGDIYADITITGGEILIDEKEKEHACRCLCLFTIDYEVTNLKPGKYKIRVIEHYVTEADEPLVCTIDLTAGSSGKCCVERQHHPWD
jgi:hypothetical protein